MNKDGKSAAVATRNENLFLMPAASTELALSRYQEVKKFIEGVLHENVDFGKVPGSDKPTLLKPGSEKMCALFGLTPKFVPLEVIEDFSGEQHSHEPFFFYKYKAELYRGGQFMGDAIGSCNSWETKYRYRNQDYTCPACGKPTIFKSKFAPKGKPKEKPGWYCFGKKGGCGKEFAADDPTIVTQPRGKVKNPDPAELVNTIDKMAQKRSLIAAVLIVTNTSEYFTQDVEDMNLSGVEQAEYSVVDESQPQAEQSQAEKPADKPTPPKEKPEGKGKSKPKSGGKPTVDDNEKPNAAEIKSVIGAFKIGKLSDEKITASLDILGRQFTKGFFNESLVKLSHIEGKERKLTPQMLETLENVEGDFLSRIAPKQEVTGA